VPLLCEQLGLRIVTNAGGLNPPSRTMHCGRILAKAGLDAAMLGVVTGDDILDRTPRWIEDGLKLPHLETGAPIQLVIILSRRALPCFINVSGSFANRGNRRY
jgi:hypothetical protein